MENNETTRAEWHKLTADMLQQEPPISVEEWRRQLAVERILARILVHLAGGSEHELLEILSHELQVPVGAGDKVAFANVFRRIAFLIREHGASV